MGTGLGNSCLVSSIRARGDRKGRQSDTDKRTNRNFIEKALVKGCRGASEVIHIDLHVDQDSRGEVGSPVIPDTMRRKIAQATALVADLTLSQLARIVKHRR